MKFQRMQRYERVTWTERKLQAYKQREQRIRQKIDKDYPLLGAELLAEPMPAPDPDAELAARRAASAASEKSMRDLAAKHWRHGRAQYHACDEATRTAISSAWDRWTGPRTPGMWIYIVESHNGVAEERRQRYRAEEAAFKQTLRVAVTAQGQLAL